MKTGKKIIAVIIAILLILSVLPLSAFASDEKSSENAANTSKEEVVYINLNFDGSVKDIYVVNAFDTGKADSIIDYGNYESLRNMTGSDEIEYDNDTVIIDSSSGKLYYEGKLKENSIPWKIQIRYFLDEKEYSADELAGKSGKLRIGMNIKQNPNCTSSFFEAYALQVTFTLNTDIAENIKAEGGTIANIGADKQISYTILPNTEKYLELTADVKDFEMESISVNGLRMKLDIEFDETAIREKIDELINAVSELKGQLDSYSKFYEGLLEYTYALDATAEGATVLTEGVETLLINADELKAAVGELNIAVGTLKNGTSELKEGSDELKSGTDEFVSETSKLHSQVHSEIKRAIAKLTGENVETVSFVSSKNTNIEAVQFVMQTENISKGKAATVAADESESLTFWQKLLRLFGLY